MTDDEVLNGEPIRPDQLADAQVLIKIFGEPLARKIFSRNWNVREQGLNNIEEAILS